MTGRVANSDSGQRVASRTGTIHAVGTRRRSGRRTTVCGWEIDHTFGARTSGSPIGCARCRGILEDPARNRGADPPGGSR
jgi:hypothetical protein